jgi:calcineurin-like phosphoesterase family protein
LTMPKRLIIPNDSRLFFSSDRHFDHENILKYSKRPFSSVTEMNDVMIRRHNDMIGPNDVYVDLGDFCWRKTRVAEFFSALNGVKHFVVGNHDDEDHIRYLSGRDGMPITVSDILEIQHRDKLIVASHYPMRSWNCSFHGSIHIYGHVHGNVHGFGSAFEVGVDPNGYSPVSFEKLLSEVDRQLVHAAYDLSDDGKLEKSPLSMFFEYTHPIKRLNVR